jgi:MFS family permease
MSAAAPPAPEIRVRRNLWVLVAAQVVLGSQLPVTFILGGLAGQLLAPNKCLATLPISVIIVGTMLSAPMLADLMQRRGRRLGFVLGAAGGGVGSAICALALVRGSFGLFLAGSLLSGLYMSAQGFYRFAATDGASDDRRAKAISYVMGAGLASAVLGPQLVRLFADALAPVPFAGAYLAAAGLNLVGVWVFAFLDSPPPKPPAPGSAAVRSRLELLRTPRIAVAMICAMVSYALMNLVMTSTPLAIVGCGFATAQAADVVSGHVLAMFVPSFFTGHLIARFGVERVIAAGLVILAAAGGVGLSGVTLPHFALALILLGIGWNFGFIGATAMLAGAHTPEERGRVQGINDFAVFALVGVASLASGGLMNCTGGDPVAGWTAVNLAMAPFLVAAGAALIWLALTRGKPAAVQALKRAGKPTSGR